MQRAVQHCVSHSPFYVRSQDLSHVLKTAGSSLSAVPPGWTSYVTSVWRAYFPPDHVPRTHGWKVHIGATSQDCASTIELVSKYCFETGVAFKYLASERQFFASNIKEANRAGSGKLITIYPSSDAALCEIVDSLNVVLEGRQSPYILSDVRYRGGPLFFRYGAFVPLVIENSDGEYIAALPTEDGLLVEDKRVPRFILPEGSPLPRVVEEAVNEYRKPLNQNELDSYSSVKPIHFSNGGGVFKATSLETGAVTILKEARPFAGLDRDGGDSLLHQNREIRALTLLEGMGVAPRFIRRFTVWEHSYLELEYLAGKSLSSWRNEFFPFNQVGQDRSNKESYKLKAVVLCRAIIDTVKTIHEKGVIIGDIHPGNIIVRPDDTVAFIDFEDVRDPGSQDSATFNVLYYGAPSGCGPFEGDWFSVSRVLASIFSPLFVYEVLSPAYWEYTLAQIEREFGPEAIAIIKEAVQYSGIQVHRGVALTPNQSPTPLASDPFQLQYCSKSISNFKGAIIEGILSQKHREPGYLFSGSVDQFENSMGAVNISTGAAGVLLALHRAGQPPSESDLQWLIDMSINSISASRPEVGLFDGLAGTACFLAEAGRFGDTAFLWDYIFANIGKQQQLGLASGLAGVGLAALSLGVSNQNEYYFNIARQIGDHIEDRVRWLESKGVTATILQKAGLLEGWSGVSLLWTALAIHSEDNNLRDKYLSLSDSAILADLQKTEFDKTGTLGVFDPVGNRSLPYLGWGTAGILYALSARSSLSEDLALEVDSELLDGMVRACTSEIYVTSGLYMGRSGVIAALSSARETVTNAEAMLRDQVTRLREVSFILDGNVHLTDHHVLRLSDDYSTGGAGVVSALNALDGTPWSILPVVDPPGLFGRRRFDGSGLTNLKGGE